MDRIKGRNSFTIRVGDFNNGKNQRVRRKIEDLNNTINQQDLRDISENSTHQQQNIHSFPVHVRILQAILYFRTQI